MSRVCSTYIEGKCIENFSLVARSEEPVWETYTQIRC
jgi:hypothetical protein